MWPLVAVIVAGIVVALWWRRRQPEKARQSQFESLTALATALGGVASGPDDAAAWSAQLAAPFQDDTEGFVGALSTWRQPRFEAALDFQRGPWRVRVSEASIEKITPTGPGDTNTRHEHRIDIATAQLPPMKLSRRWHTDFRGRPLDADHILAQGGKSVREAPATVAQRQGPWQQLRLPGQADNEFAVFATDHTAAKRLLNPEVLEYLVASIATLPSATLTFEAGLCYATVLDRINPRTLPQTTDAMVGLLDRIHAADGQR